MVFTLTVSRSGPAVLAVGVVGVARGDDGRLSRSRSIFSVALFAHHITDPLTLSF